MKHEIISHETMDFTDEMMVLCVCLNMAYARELHFFRDDHDEAVDGMG